MRKLFFTAAAVALALSAAGMAQAQSNLPANVKVTGGALTDAAGKALYTYDNDTMKSMSHCVGQCARSWPPLEAPANAQASGDWTIVMREDGKRQWAYKDKPLYYFVRDVAGQPPKGGSVESWQLAKP